MSQSTIQQSLQRAQPAETTAFEAACESFLAAQPQIAELHEQIRALKNANKEHVTTIKVHMLEQKIDELTVGAFVFSNKSKEHCRWNEKNLAELDEELVEKYRERFTETKQAFSMRKPKKRKMEEGEAE